MKKYVLVFLMVFSTIFSFAQCDFTASPTNAANSGCFLAIEDVVFTSLTNVVATGNSINKTAGGTNWNAEGISTAVVYDNGYMEFIVTETNRTRMIGLSNTNTNSNWNTIQYAFYLNNTNLEIRESGSGNRVAGQTVATGDTLRVSVEDGVVNYYKNGTLLYISGNAPTLPLLVDNSIRQVGGTFSNVVVANVCDGNFTAYSTGPGTTPTYTWKVNGVTLQTGASSTYTNTGLSPSDIVTCELLPGGVGACSGVLEISNDILIENISNYSIGEFYIEGTAVASACNYAEEKVVWRNSSLNNLDANGDSLYKIQSNNNWNGGAASFNTVSNDGYMQFVVTETNRTRMIGLSNSNTNNNWNTIQYAFYLNNANLEIRESGSGNRIAGQTVATGDTLKISVESGVVNYYKNNSLLYISGIAPTLPLLIDVSIRQTGGSFNNVVVANYNTGDFTATATNAGATPTYTWKVNGFTVQSGASNTYSNSGLADNDVLTCELTPNHNGCAALNFVSNAITNKAIDYPLAIDFYIEGTVAASACNTVEEYVAWRISDLNNVDATADSLYKVQSNNNWDGGAASWNTVSNEGYMQFIVTETNRTRMIGLSNTNTNNNWNTIQYAFYLNNANLEIRESGSGNRIAGQTVATGDTLRISVESGVVNYYKNSSLLYISAIAPTLPLLVDASIRQVGGTFSNVVVSNYNTGDFTATATNAGGSPSYQWVLNGVNVGANSPNYSNTNLNDGDTLTCILTPSIAGCSFSNYESNIVINRVVDNPTSIDFYVEGTVAASACNTVEEYVAWRITDLNNVDATADSLYKVQSNNNWDGGAASWNTVSNEGYMQFIVTEVNRTRMIGLSNANTNDNWNTIQYAFYLNNANLEIRESGSGNRIAGQTVATGDTLKIAVESGVVHYYKNSTVLYISAIAPTLPLLVDASIRQVGGTFSNVVVSNYNTGDFTATATNAGGSPSYQWVLNGVNVGANSPNYTNTNLNDGDTITCILTPSIAGCSNDTYTSNIVINREVDDPTSIEFYITGTVSVSACTEAIEDVAWQVSSLNNVNATNNNLNKVQSNNNWDGGAASWNTVSNEGYFEFVVSETNRTRMIGLSNTNTNNNWNTIQYAFYLNNANLEIRESGSGNRIGAQAIVTGDILRISVESGVVKYYRNQALLYTSAIAPTLPLLVDVSIRQTGGTITDAIIVNNATAGNYSATSTNAGTNPIYDWKVNGFSVQTGLSNTYTNTSLVTGDILTCELTPDLNGCSTTMYVSNEIEIRGPGNPITWNGVTSTNWFTPSNWTPNGIPDRFSAVTIPNGTPNSPSLGSSSNVYDLQLNAGAAFTITGTNTLGIYHDLVNNGGSITANNSTINFVGCSNPNTLNTTGTTTLYNVVLDNDSDLTVVAGTNNISNSFTFTNGMVYQNANLTFLNGATWTGANATRYVQGSLVKRGNQAFTFPVGKNDTAYAPISISAPTLATDEFTAEYFQVNPDSVTPTPYTRTSLDPTLNHVSGCEYWILDRTNGSANVNVTLTWDTRSCGVTNLGDLRVARWDGAVWRDHGNGGTTGNNASGTVVTSAAVTTFSPFTLASTTFENPLPIELLSFIATANGNQVDLNWLTASEINNDYFTVEKSKDGQVWVEVSEQAGAGNSNVTLEYYDVDLNPYSGTSYYRLKQTDFDGAYSYSQTVVVNRSATIYTVYPNPTTTELNISGLNGTEYVKVYSSDGRIVFEGSANVLNTESWSHGMYQLIIFDADDQLLDRFKVIK